MCYRDASSSLRPLDLWYLCKPSLLLITIQYYYESCTSSFSLDNLLELMVGNPVQIIKEQIFSL
jgi:hypothetical protein